MPGSQRFVPRNVGRTAPLDAKQVPVHKMQEGLLHTSLGEAGPLRKLRVVEAGAALLGRRRQDQEVVACME